MSGFAKSKRAHTTDGPFGPLSAALLLWCVCLLSLSPSLAAEPVADPDLTVTVEKRGERVIVDARMAVAASPPVVWGVLTDFDHMAAFISNLQASSARKLDERSVEVSQKGLAAYGPLSFAFETVRRVELVPPETIRSYQVSGTTKFFEGITRVTFAGGRAEISYHGESVPGVWIPPVIGLAFIRNQTEEQFR
jgi:carbon monoxide dehydrogenase subunit G